MSTAKRILSFVLTAALLFSVATVAPFTAGAAVNNSDSVGAALTFGDFKYNVYGSEAVITGYTGSGGTVRIPSLVSDGSSSYNVTEIGRSAFANNESIIEVIIPDSVTFIGAAAFRNCKYLKTVKLGINVKTIDFGDDGGVFQGCVSLDEIVIPNSVEEIGSRSFKGCTGLKKVTIGSGVKTIGYVSTYDIYEYGAFQDCSSLATVTFIGNNLEVIGKQTFKGCTALKGISLPNSVNVIGKGAFQNCTQLRSITIPDKLTYIAQATFRNCSSLNTLNLGNGVQTIDFGDDGGAFQGCVSLEELVIPNNVKDISARAFMGCTGLKKVTIGSGLKKLGYNRQPNIYDYGVFEDCTSLEEVMILKGDLECIGIQAFKNCTSLKKISIPANVTQIGIATSTDDDLVNKSSYSAAFYNCSDELTIYGVNDTFAHKFAIANGIKWNGTGYMVPPSKVSLNTYSITLRVGGTYQLYATVYPDDATDKRIEWSSQNRSIADISYGKVTAKSVGTTTVTAKTYNGKTATCSVTVEPQPVYATKIEILPSDLLMTPGESKQLSVKFTPDNVTDTYVNWSSSDGNVVSASSTGRLTALKEGTSTITAVSSNGCKSVCEVRVKNTSLRLALPASFKRVELGESLPIELVMVSSKYDFDDLTVTPDESGIVKLERIGLNEGTYKDERDERHASFYFKGVGKGETRVTFTTPDGQKTYVDIEVFRPNYEIKLYSYQPSLIINKGTSIPCGAELYCDGELMEDYGGLLFTVSDDTVANIENRTVYSDHTEFSVKAKKEGTVTLTALYDKKNVLYTTTLEVNNGVQQFNAVALPQYKDKYDYNCFVNGMIITDYKYERSEGKAKDHMTFDVYNTTPLIGSVDIYNAAGELIESERIDRFSETYMKNTKEWVTASWHVVTDLFTGKLLTFKQQSYSKKTSVDIYVPKGGKVIVTNDPYTSITCSLYNYIEFFIMSVDVGTSVFKTVSSIEKVSTQVSKDIMKAAFAKKSFSALYDLQNKIYKSGVKALAKDAFPQAVTTFVNDGNKVLTDHSFDLAKMVSKTAASFGVGLAESAVLEGLSVFGLIIKGMFTGYTVGDYICMAASLLTHQSNSRVEIYVNGENGSLVDNGVTIDPMANGTALAEYNCVLRARQVTQGIENVRNSVNYTVRNIQMRDIYLEKDGEAVQPQSNVKVRIPVPKGYQAENCRVYRIDDDGMKEMETTVEDNMLVFTTNHFCYWAIIEELIKRMGDADIDGNVSIQDATLVQQVIADLKSFNGEQKFLADVNGDGKISVSDVTMIQKYIAKILVLAPVPEAVTISEAEIKLEAGDSVSLTAEVLPKNAVSTKVSWSSSNPDAAAVDENGKVTAVAPGNTVITASTLNGKKMTCAVEVLKTIGGYYPVYTARDLYNIRYNPNGKYKLMDRIDLSEYENWDPIPEFSGELNGNGYDIINLSMSYSNNTSAQTGEKYFGLIRDIKGNTVFNNVKIDGKIDIKAYTQETVYTGFLFARSYADKVTFNYCTVFGEVECSGWGNKYVGGFFGAANNAEFNNCGGLARVNTSSNGNEVMCGGYCGAVYNPGARVINNCTHSGYIDCRISRYNAADNGRFMVGGFAGYLGGATELTGAVNYSKTNFRITINFCTGLNNAYISSVAGYANDSDKCTITSCKNSYDPDIYVSDNTACNVLKGNYIGNKLDLIIMK